MTADDLSPWRTVTSAHAAYSYNLERLALQGLKVTHPASLEHTLFRALLDDIRGLRSVLADDRR